jgi:hypothetical protein
VWPFSHFLSSNGKVKLRPRHIRKENILGLSRFVVHSSATTVREVQIAVNFGYRNHMMYDNKGIKFII